MKRQKYVSPKGIAKYPCLKKSEVYEGVETGFYTIQMMFNKADTDKLEAFLLGELEKIQGLPEYANKKFTNPTYGFRTTKDGDVLVKFKTQTSFTSRTTGETIKKTLPIFDSEGKPLPATANPGSGTSCKVAYSINPYHKGRNCGLTLYLEAVQVLDLVEFGGGGSANAFGFDKEDGYKAADADDIGDGSPFSDDTDEDASDF